jgi:hypothetical protein
MLQAAWGIDAAAAYPVRVRTVKREHLAIWGVLATLPAHLRGLPMVQLPSTSPANARLAIADKARAWSVLATYS